MIHTGSGFLTGANLPWITYGCDFGANAWQPEGGLSARGLTPEAERALGGLRDAGGSLVRWFLFADGRSGLKFEGERPVGLDRSLVPDVERALAAVQAANLRVIFTLFDFHWCHRAQVVNGVQLGGRRRTFRDERLRTELLDRVVAPLIEAVGHHPTVAAWDVINEPEWVTGGVRHVWPWGPVRRHHMRALIAETTALVHELSPHPVTVGSASLRWLPLVTGLGLDFYQVHWYDEIEGARTPDLFGGAQLDRPLMLGEFPSHRSRHTPAALLRMAKVGGCFAALPWSTLSDDDFSAGADEIAEALRDARTSS